MNIPPATIPEAAPSLHGQADAAVPRWSRGGVHPLLAALACFLLSLAMHLPWLANTPIAGTEGHRIFPAHAMVQTHWWLAPTLFGQPFMTKPPLHHWLIAVSEICSGGGESFNVGGPKALFFWRLPSAIAGAALCSAVCLFAARWFGRTAGLVSGFSAVGMIAIWGQSQVADIDSTNTLVTAVAALCGVELLIIGAPRRGLWLIATTLSLAAMVMTKGPAGLPIVLGVWIWAIVLRLSRPRAVAGEPHGLTAAANKTGWGAFLLLWFLPLLLAAGVGLGWKVLAWRSVAQHGFPLDDRGMKEAGDRLLARSPTVLLLSLFVMLPQVIAFALPISAALPLYFRRDIRAALPPASRNLAGALIGATLVSWGVCVVSGMVNPRYAYPTLMLLCPLAGAVAVAAVKNIRSADWLRGIGFASIVAYVAATTGLAAAAWHAVGFRPLLVSAVVFSLIVGIFTWRALSRSWAGGWGLAGLMALASIPFGVQRHWSRSTKDSGLNTVPRILAVTGPDAALAVGGAVTSRPETFYYSHLRVHFVPPAQLTPGGVRRGTWVMLDQAEHKHWLKQPGGRLQNDQKICRWGDTDYFLAWYPAQ